MQKIEQNTEIKSDRLKPADKNDKDTYKTRKGKIGGYKDYLSKDEIKYLTLKMKEQQLQKLKRNLILYFQTLTLILKNQKGVKNLYF